MQSFKTKVIQIVSKIPKGKVMTYKQVANLAGNSNASRAVGTIMSHNHDKNIPCHRVVRSDGIVGGYNGLRTLESGSKSKINLLKKEGVNINNKGKIVFN